MSIVLGSYGSGVSMAGGDVFAAAGIPAIGISCTNPNVTLLCDYYWRICFLDPFQGSVMANFAAEKGCKKAYVLTMLGEDYGNGLGYYFTDAFQKLGGEVVAETFPEGNERFQRLSEQRRQGGLRRDLRAQRHHLRLPDHRSGRRAEHFLSRCWLATPGRSSVILDAAKGKNVDVCVSTFFAEDDEQRRRGRVRLRLQGRGSTRTPPS